MTYNMHAIENAHQFSKGASGEDKCQLFFHSSLVVSGPVKYVIIVGHEQCSEIPTLLKIRHLKVTVNSS